MIFFVFLIFKTFAILLMFKNLLMSAITTTTHSAQTASCSVSNICRLTAYFYLSLSLNLAIYLYLLRDKNRADYKSLSLETFYKCDISLELSSLPAIGLRDVYIVVDSDS